MPKYQVHLVVDTRVEAYVMVEANNAEEAEDKAYELDLEDQDYEMYGPVDPKEVEVWSVELIE